jgi:NTE family protein
MEHGPRVGLVLGGGGAVGHGFHRGALAALEDVAGFDPGGAAVIVGTSSGASTAALLRAGFTGSDLAARACDQPCSTRMLELRRTCAPPAITAPLPTRPRLGPPASRRGALAALRRAGTHLPGTLVSSLLPSGRVPTVTGGGRLDALFGEVWPGDGLWIVAWRLDDGARVVFGRGGAPDTDVATAVAASCALPGWYSPVVVDGERYFDGAAWSTTNADVLVGEPLDLVVVIAPLCAAATPFHRLQGHYLGDEVRRLRAAGVPVVVIDAGLVDVVVMGPNIMDRARRDAVTRYVRARTTRRLQRGDLVGEAELVRSMASRSDRGDETSAPAGGQRDRVRHPTGPGR